MPGTKPEPDRTLITSAGKSRSLDIDERNKRYLFSMAVRTACFLGFLVLPGWWKVVCLAGATVLPAIAVLLANASDSRPPPLATWEDEDEGARVALPGSPVIEGTIEES